MSQEPRTNNKEHKALRVLILNWRDPKHPLAGGAEISLLEHAKYWQRRGARITWFTSSFENAKKEESVDGIRYIRRGSHFTVHVLFFVYYLLNRDKIKNFDVIIDCFHFLPFFTPLYIKNKKIAALINEVAGRVWFSNLPFPFSWIGYKLEPYFFKFYKNIPFITASNSAKDDLLKVGLIEKNITIIPHGVLVVRVDKNIKKEKDPTLIFVGRVSKDKGIEDALKTFIRLKQKTQNLKLWIVGREERKGYIAEVFKVLKADKATRKDITCFGYVSEEEKFELMKKGWILIHPSQKEGWGLNVIEANSVGTPAVGYNVEGLRDSIVGGKTGVLVNPDAESLARGVEKLLESKSEIEKLSKNAIKWSEKFNWERAGDASYKLITSI